MTIRKRLFIVFNLAFPAVVSFALIFSILFAEFNSLLTIQRSKAIVVIFLFFFMLVFLTLAIFAWRQIEKIISQSVEFLNNHTNFIWLFIVAIFVFLLFTLILTTPDKYMGRFLIISERLHPVLILGFIINIQVLLNLAFWKFKKNARPFSLDKSLLNAFLITLGLIGAVWIFIATTSLGVIGDNSFWSKPGVPILWPQIFLACGVGIALLSVTSRLKNKFLENRRLDLALVFLIWLTSTLLWSGQSYQQGTFDTSPRPPVYEIYPINDSFIFDNASQQMLIGRDIAGDVIDKSLYITFLAIMHLVAGNSYALFYQFQILFFALIPVIGYFIGKTLHSRPFGLTFASILIIKEFNAIKLTNYLQVSTSKMILSEPLTTLGILLFLYFLINWLRSPQANKFNLHIAGGILGLTCLVRLNAIGILVPAIFLIGLKVKLDKRKWLTTSLIFILFIVSSWLPWMGRNLIKSNNPFSFINAKTSGVIMNQRYNPMISNTQPDSETQQDTPQKLSKYINLARSITTNYLHSLVGITLMIPPSIEGYKLLDLVRLPYWFAEWKGQLLPGGFWILGAILIVISLGIATSWKRWKLAGLAPLAVMLGYNITTGLSLTSGGRYIVPIDWAALLYFSLGLLELVEWLLDFLELIKKDYPPIAQLEPLKVVLYKHTFEYLLLAFLFLGSLPVIFETIPPLSYPAQASIVDFISANKTLPEFSSEKIQNYLITSANDPKAVVIYGKALYPRYYKKNTGEGPVLAAEPLIGNADFDRLTLFIISTQTNVPVIIPISGKQSTQLPSADTWIFGCQRENYVEAISVVSRAKGSVILSWINPLEKTCEE